MELPTLKVERLYRQISNVLINCINTGQFAPGAMIPSERDLSKQLGVSRSSIREALIALEIEGQVEIRMGSGVYVCQRGMWRNRLPSFMGESPVEVMHARAAFEGAVIVQACVHATPQGLARVQDSVESMRADIAAGRDVLDHDREFHVRIAEMTGNSVMVGLVGTLFDMRREPLANHMRTLLEGEPVWNAALHEHEQILRCLQSRDPLAAEAAIRSHIRAAAERWVTP